MNFLAGKEPDIRDMGSIPGWEDSLEESMATQFSILAWRIQQTEESSRPESIGSQLSDMTEATYHACMHEMMGIY